MYSRTLVPHNPGDWEVSHTLFMWNNLLVTLYKDEVGVSWKMNQQRTDTCPFCFRVAALLCHVVIMLYLSFCFALFYSATIWKQKRCILTLVKNDFKGILLQLGRSISCSIFTTTRWETKRRKLPSSQIEDFPDKITKWILETLLYLVGETQAHVSGRIFCRGGCWKRCFPVRLSGWARGWPSSPAAAKLGGDSRTAQSALSARCCSRGSGAIVC